MKRGSLVTPVLLILIGALFLVVNLDPDVGFVEVVGRYWPFLLILWGGMRLVEVLVDALRRQPLPRVGIRGGEWVLVVLICLAGSGVRFARDRIPFSRIEIHGVELFGQPFDYTSQVSQPVDGQTRVLVENLNGNVRIVGGEGNEVTAQSRTTVRALSKEDADQDAAAAPLEIEANGDQIVIRTNQERKGGSSTISTDLEIAVPSSFSVIARGRDNEFDVSNVSGNVELESTSAGVRLVDVTGSANMKFDSAQTVRVSSVSGDVTLEGRVRTVDMENIGGLVLLRGSYTGGMRFRHLPHALEIDGSRTQLRVEQVTGELRMEPGQLNGDGLVGPTRISRRSSDLRLSDYTGDLTLETDRGDVELYPVQAPLGATEVRVNSGNIEITIPGQASFGLLARTQRGEITNDYGPSLTLSSSDASDDSGGQVLSGPAGHDTTMRLTTERGDITIRGTGSSTPMRPTQQL